MISASNPVLINYAPLTFKQKFRKNLYHFPKQFKTFVVGLFPIIQWIHRYNLSVSNYRIVYMLIQLFTLLIFNIVASSRCYCGYYSGYVNCATRNSVCKDCKSGSTIRLIVSIFICVNIVSLN